jgi:hypothetical protein
MASPFQLCAADAADAAERNEDLRALLLRKAGEYLATRATTPDKTARDGTVSPDPLHPNPSRADVAAWLGRCNRSVHSSFFELASGYRSGTIPMGLLGRVPDDHFLARLNLKSRDGIREIGLDQIASDESLGKQDKWFGEGTPIDIIPVAKLIAHGARLGLPRTMLTHLEGSPITENARILASGGFGAPVEFDAFPHEELADFAFAAVEYVGRVAATTELGGIDTEPHAAADETPADDSTDDEFSDDDSSDDDSSDDEDDDPPPPAVARRSPAVIAGHLGHPFRIGQAKAVELMRAQSYRGSFKFGFCCGYGKTGLLVAACRYLRDRNTRPFRAVCFVPTQFLATTTADRFAACGLKTAQVHSASKDSSSAVRAADVIVCVYNSVDKLPAGDVRVVIVDESHHVEVVPNEECYRAKCVAYGARAGLCVWLSGTPRKRAGLCVWLSGTPRKRESYDVCVSACDAVAEGAILPVGLIAPVYDGAPEHRVAAIANYLWSEPTRHDKILAFCNTVTKARSARKIFRKVYGKRAHVVTAATTMAQRRAILEDFAKLGACVIVSVNTLIEGVDIPLADTAVLLEPRSSPVNLGQLIGRVQRTAHDSEGNCAKGSAWVVLPTSDCGGEVSRFIRALRRDMPDLARSVAAGNRSTLGAVVVHADALVDVYDATASLHDCERVLGQIHTFAKGSWWCKVELLEEFVRVNGRLPARRDVAIDGTKMDCG